MSDSETHVIFVDPVDPLRMELALRTLLMQVGEEAPAISVLYRSQDERQALAFRLLAGTYPGLSLRQAVRVEPALCEVAASAHRILLLSESTLFYLPANLSALSASLGGGQALRLGVAEGPLGLCGAVLLDGATLAEALRHGAPLTDALNALTEVDPLRVGSPLVVAPVGKCAGRPLPQTVALAYFLCGYRAVPVEHNPVVDDTLHFTVVAELEGLPPLPAPVLAHTA